MAVSVQSHDLAYDAGDFYDEAVDSDGRPRPGYGRILDALPEADPAETCARIDGAIARLGATFRSANRQEPFPVCPIPRLIAGEEWAWLERGLAQRARALGAFIADAYGERAIVDAGIVPAHVIDGADHFEPAMAGLLQPAGHAQVIGFDLVRGGDGRLRVREDNLRTPSGLAYSAAVRCAIDGELPDFGLERVELDPSFTPLRTTLEEAAGDRADAAIALLTDGAANSAFYEHRTLARRLGIALVTPEQLRLQGGRLSAELPSGRLRPLDVIYRRTDEDRLTDERGRSTWIAQLLLEPLRRGTLVVVNAPGAGVADDKLLHAYAEEMIRFYLGEEPLIESVRTFDLMRPDVLTKVLDRLSALVVKPRSGQGGKGARGRGDLHRPTGDRGAAS